MIPNVVALAFSYVVGRSGDIRWHLAVVCLIGSGGFLLLPVAATVSLALFLAAVSIITGYTIAYYGPLNTALQNRIGAHAGPLALVTTIGSLGGFFGPTPDRLGHAGDRRAVDAGSADIRADDAGQRRAGDRLRAQSRRRASAAPSRAGTRASEQQGAGP